MPPYKGITYISVLNNCRIVKASGNKWPNDYWLCFPNFIRKPGWPCFRDSDINLAMVIKNLVLYLPRKTKG